MVTRTGEREISAISGRRTTNAAHIWRRRRDLNPGHIGGRRALSPLRHPLHYQGYRLRELIDSSPRRKYFDHMGEFACGYWGLKG